MSSKPRESWIIKAIEDIPRHMLFYLLIIVIILLTYGIIGSILIMKLDLINSVYFTGITITTLGYGDIVPVTPLQKIFTVSLAIGGVGLFAYVFRLSILIAGERIEEIRSGAKMKRTINSLKDHYILCGYGRVGSVVVEELEKRNQTIVVIDNDRDVTEGLEEDSDLLVIHGDATEERNLHKAGIEKAGGIILTTGSDVDNLFIALTSREISKDIWIVSRASKKENIPRLYNSGANEVISPEESGGTDIYFAAIQPNLIKITTKHSPKDIEKEMKIILKYKCSIENIEYHYPYFKEPLKRKIEVSSEDQIDKFIEKVDAEKDTKEALEAIYETVNGIHSHWISGPNHKTLNKMVEALKKENLIYGVNLTHKEIMKIAKKDGKIKLILKKEEEEDDENKKDKKDKKDKNK